MVFDEFREICVVQMYVNGQYVVWSGSTFL